MAVIIHTMSQTNESKPKIGGSKNIWGVSLMNAAVVFMTAIPTLMFLQLQHTQRMNAAQMPQTTYAPYS
jgi:hypothetical protein